ncbi:aldo/keto reductase [Halpernia humi]|uniref:aldo/keto reductase n=1 Tax=Halpernia humi TaxID=493375 RepID=UPI000CDE8A3C|nr:aldo/keto reductase [Halpernia humi]
MKALFMNANALVYRSSKQILLKKNHGLLDKIKPIVEQHQASLSQLVLRWTIERQEIKISLAGARNAQKSTQNAKEIDLKLNKEELQSIDE